MLKTITPINNTIYVERNFATSQEIESALDISKKVFNDWKIKSIEERKIILNKFVDCFLENKNSFDASPAHNTESSNVI